MPQKKKIIVIVRVHVSMYLCVMFVTYNRTSERIVYIPQVIIYSRFLCLLFAVPKDLT